MIALSNPLFSGKLTSDCTQCEPATNSYTIHRKLMLSLALKLALKQEKDASTPVSNTGSNDHLKTALTCAVDWLQVTCKIYDDGSDFRRDANFVVDYFQDSIIWEDKSIFMGRRYELSGRSTLGIRFAYTPSSLESEGYGWLSIPGGVCSTIGAKMFDLIMYLAAWGYKATRIDLNIDDFDRAIKFEQLSKAVEQGNYSGCKTPVLIAAHEKGKTRDQLGFTWRFGSPSSDKLVRIYDKNVESEGRINAIRVEVQYRNELAHKVFTQLSVIPLNQEDVPELVPLYIAGCIMGAIDFRDLSESCRRSRASQLSWWQKFCNRLQSVPIRISRAPAKQAIEKTLRWINSQVQSSLAMIYEVMGYEGFYSWMNRQISEGKARFSDFHQATISTTNRLSDEHRLRLIDHS